MLNLVKEFPIHKQLSHANFRIDLARTPEQLKEIFALRYKIFNLELHQGLAQSTLTALDKDQYDDYCDHLIVIDETHNIIVGNYRLLPFSRVKNNIGLYSESEFNLDNIRAADLKLVEVGRACIHPDYRDGTVINLLWYGIAVYMQANGLEYLSGCVSLHKEDDGKIASQIYRYCEQENFLVDPALQVSPKQGHSVADFNPHIDIDINKKLKRLLPTLLRGYLAIGCKIGGYPAYDHEFGVIDFFILLKFSDLTDNAATHFLR